MREKILISMCAAVVVLCGAFAVWQVTAPCESLQKWLPFANAQNRCIEHPKAVVPTPKPVTKPVLKPTEPPTVAEIETKLNEYRASRGLGAIADSSTLDTAAQARAEGMCADNNWSHSGDWAVLRQYYSYSDAGENLYYGGLRPDQENDVLASWIASPEHLANLVGGYSQFGIGIKVCDGFQDTTNAVIVTNYFGVPN